MRILFVCLLFILSHFVKAQLFELRGKVVDEQNSPLTGATVYIHETFQGNTTSDSGNFLIENIQAGNYHLHVTYLGFKSYSVNISFPADSANFFFITLIASKLELNEAVIEADVLRLDRNERSTPIEVLGETDLLKTGASTLGQALEQLPGVNSINMGIGVSKPVIRGLSGNRILVAENGIKQEGQQWGADHGLEIDPLNIERVEILKGPASLLYGSDAMGGVVHIRQPLVPIEGKHEAKIAFLGKSVNANLGTSFLARGNRKGLSYRIRGTYFDYGDYKVPSDSFKYNNYILPIYGNKLKNTAGKEAHLSAQLGLNRKWGFTRLTFSRFKQKIGLFSGAVGIPREYLLIDDGDNRNLGLPYQDIEHIKFISNSSIRFGKNWFEADIGYQINNRKELSNPHAHGQLPSVQFGSIAHQLVLQTFSANLRYHHRINKKFELIYGASTQEQINRFSGFEFLLPEFTTAQGATYSVFTWKPKNRITLNGGIRIDLAQINIREHKQFQWKNYQIVGETVRVAENTRNFINWSSSIGASIDLSSKWNLKLNIGKSFRTPTAQELSVNGVHHGSFRHEMGDPNLKSEEAIQFDLGIAYEAEKFRIALSPYVNIFSNYIFLRPTAQFSTLPEAGQIYAFEQASALIGGGELQSDWHPIKSIHFEMGLEYVFAQNLQSNYPLPFIPPFQIKSAFEWQPFNATKRWKETYIRASVQKASSQNRVDRNERETAGFTLLNLGAGTEISSNKSKVCQVFISVNNLFNTAYFNHLSRWRYLNLSEPGRNITLQVIVPLW